mmetsp:Transcript_37296/g.33459  ORF Transcript_37296/g.33459 Transcript_37296/m.33459 type:complete len:85 (-) Transcript_37296:959-1213(-)
MKTLNNTNPKLFHLLFPSPISTSAYHPNNPSFKSKVPLAVKSFTSDSIQEEMTSTNKELEFHEEDPQEITESTYDDSQSEDQTS